MSLSEALSLDSLPLPAGLCAHGLIVNIYKTYSSLHIDRYMFWVTIVCPLSIPVPEEKAKQ